MIFCFLLLHLDFAYSGQNHRHVPKSSYNYYGSYYNYGYYYGHRRTTAPPPPPPIIPKTCPPGWILYPGPFPVCMFRSPDKVNWDTANARCRAMGAILAEPRTNAEVSFVTGGQHWAYFYIGIRVAPTCVATYASSGLPVPGKGAWYQGYPTSCGVHPCVWTYQQDDFRNADCTTGRRFVCQMPLGGYTSLTG